MKQHASGEGARTAATRAPARTSETVAASVAAPAFTQERRVAPAQALQLQRVVGNQAVGRRLLRVGPADGPLEREADRAADAGVRSMSATSHAGDAEPPPNVRAYGTSFVACKREGAGAGVVVPERIAGGIAQARGQGRPLTSAVRGPMERAFGADLGAVRVHTGAHADGLSRSLAARAFTCGVDVFFRGGAYDPTSAAGRHLLAHELAHVVLHGSAPVVHRRALGELQFARGYDKLVQHPGWAAEAEAYEKRLGSYCYQHPKARRAVDATLRRMQEVLAGYFKPRGRTDAEVADAFLKDDESSAGQVGTGDAERKLAVLFERGNLRERMTALYNAAYYKAGYARDAGVSLKTILNAVTMGGPRFDERTANALKLDTEALRGQSAFLRDNTRAGLYRTIKRFRPDKAYTFDSDIFALGNLYYQHSGGRKHPFQALREMKVSQEPRVDRSRLEKSVGQHKKTPRDYAEMLAPLSDRERGFLARQDRPLTVAEHAIDPAKVAGTHTDPQGHQVTLDGRGDPRWEEEEFGSLAGTGHTQWRIHRTRDEARGTAQEIEIRYAFAEREPVLAADGSPQIAEITFRQLILHRSRTRLEDGQQGPELPLDWTEGTAWFTFREQEGGWVEQVRDQLGMPVVAGVSGTTTRMMGMFQWLDVPGVTPLEFRLAVMGWMLTSWDHSLFEILGGSRYAGVSGRTEHLDNAPQMYQNIPPLTREELRAEVCVDGMFPHERIYMKMARQQGGDRLVEPGAEVADAADGLKLDLEELAREADSAAHRRVRPNLPEYRSERASAQVLRERLAAAGLDPRQLSKRLSAAHIAAFKAVMRFPGLFEDVVDRPRLLAVERIRGRLERHFRRSYLQAELQVLDAKIGGGTATRAEQARAVTLRGKLTGIRALHGEALATLRLERLTSQARAIAAAPSGSPQREARREELAALLRATAEQLYAEMQVHANMLAEALDAAPGAAARVLGQ